MTIQLTNPRIGKIGATNLPFVTFNISNEDAVSGFVLEVEVAATAAAPTTVNLVNRLGDEDAAAEVAGNTLYDVNAGAAGKRHLGNLTFDFTTYKTNRVALKPGTVIGAVTLPAILSPNFALIFNDAALKIIDVRLTRRHLRAGG